MTATVCGFLLFPEVTQLDFTGPLQVLSRAPGWKTVIVAKSLDPVPSDCGLSLVPTHDFASAPKLDVLCVPGGFGVSAAIADRATMDYVARAGADASVLTSVCTGAFVLGAAGFLQGRRATTHWAYRGLLPLVGAEPVEARVVRDGHLFTGGGVTAGIDFAFTLIAELISAEAAQAIQLAIEYDPAPPFAGGTPSRTPEGPRARVEGVYAERLKTFEGELRAAMGRSAD